ncbi:MAG: hypothetical protein WA440_01855, partial [Ignavibacteriaceae bacterium]
GLAGDFCVYFSALDSADYGFKTYFIEDAVRSIDISNFEKTVKKNLIDKNTSIISSTDISFR